MAHGNSEEVGFIVDEKDNSARPRRARVLRATDVIPPFDRLPNGATAERTDCEPPKPVVQQSGDSGSHLDGTLAPGATPDVGAPLAADAEIPRYDLAENILAEQRRVAARRRRAPGQVQEEPVVVSESGDFEPSLAELPSDDLPELQRIVAEIVARDIDRLCRKPTR